MATIVAAAGGGNWTAGATWVGGVAPTSADDVYLDATSGNVTIDTTGCVCRSLDCTGYTGTLTHAALKTLTIGYSTPGPGNVALKLVPGMTYAPVNGTSSVLALGSNSGTQQTIDTGGKTLGRVNVQGPGGNYILVAPITWRPDAFFALTAGTFDTGGYAMTGAYMSMGGTTARTFNMGSATITLSGTTSSTFSVSGSNLTINPGTSNIVMTGSNAHFAGNGFTFHTLTLAAGSNVQYIDGANTFTNLVFNGVQFQTVKKLLSANQTVTGTFTSTGTSQYRLLVGSATLAGLETPGVQMTITAANVVTEYTDFQDIIGAGASGWDLSAQGSGDALGNSGITFSAPQTNYAVGVTGTTNLWSDVTKWASTSGGAGGTGRVPLPQDSVVIDSNSGSGTLSSNVMRGGKDLTWNNAAMTFDRVTVSPSFYGSINFISSAGQTGIFTLTLLARSGSHTLNTGTISSAGGYIINSIGGGATYTLTAPYLSNGSFTLTAGTFNTANYNMTCSIFWCNGTATRSLTLGTSTISLTNTTATTVWNFTTTGLTFSGASATVSIVTPSTSTRTFTPGEGVTLGTLNYTVSGSTGGLTISNGFTVGTFNFTSSNAARSLNLASGITINITTAAAITGSSGNLVSVLGVAGGSAETMNFTGTGVVAGRYLSVANSTVTPATEKWYAGDSTDAGGNSGWTFENAPGTGGKMLSMLV